MVKLFTVIYILCSVCSTNPDMSSPAFLQSIAAAEEAIAQSFTGPEAVKTQPEIPVPKDYYDALKFLGLYKEDSKDNAELNKRNAVIRFESICNMPITGKWNDKCQSALIKIYNDKQISYLDIVKNPPSEDRWLALNKTSRILTYYQKDIVIAKYPVAVGKSSTQTPSGKFTIVNKIVNPAWGGGGYANPVKGGSPDNPLGYRWMGLSLKNGGSIGIHGNNSPLSIGQYVSHGCIRMINSDVAELFENTKKDTIVWVGTESELNDWGIVQPEYSFAVN